MPAHSPGEDRLVLALLDNMLLESNEGISTFTINHRHIDVEETHEAVSSVFGSFGLNIVSLQSARAHEATKKR